MKDAEDEAFDELAKRQGHWGGGYQAKREAALDKLVQEQERLGLYDPPPQPAQEPVALVIDGVLVKSALPEKYTGHLYTAPPQREWAGLTEDEWSNLKCKSVEDVWIALTVQAKLKEKNNG